MLDQFITQEVQREIEKQLTNRGIASKSYVLSELSELKRRASPGSEWRSWRTDISEDVKTLQAQVRKLFALVDQLQPKDVRPEEEPVPRKLPRKGQLIYVWLTDNTQGRYGRFEDCFNGFENPITIIESSRRWKNWRSVRPDEI